MAKAAPEIKVKKIRLSAIRDESLLRLLVNISEELASFTQLDDALRFLVEISSQKIMADRASLFLNDPVTKELYTKFALGNLSEEIRIMNNSGISGAVFQSGQALVIDDPYADPRFNHHVDEKTGYRTKNIIAVPVKTIKGEIIGVLQVLNKQKGRFTKKDLQLLELITTQASQALDSMIELERIKKLRQQEIEFLGVISEMTSDINIESLLQKVMFEATRMLGAERSTLFLNDKKTNELWSQVGQGLGAMQIRLPNHLGIAGNVFTTGKSVNIPHAYADLRFNPSFDRKSSHWDGSVSL
jgi:adenylate cyclase